MTLDSVQGVLGQEVNKMDDVNEAVSRVSMSLDLLSQKTAKVFREEESKRNTSATTMKVPITPVKISVLAILIYHQFHFNRNTSRRGWWRWTGSENSSTGPKREKSHSWQTRLITWSHPSEALRRCWTNTSRLPFTLTIIR